MEKILDYTKPLLDISCKIHKKVLWPCFEHSVRISGLPSFVGNVFEDLILRLLSASDVKNPGQLSFDTGLEKDFVNFILDRLIQKNYLRENLELTDEGKSQLENEKSSKSQIFCIYTDAISGKLITTIEPAEARKYLAYSEGKFSSAKDNDGNKKTRKFYYNQTNSTAGNESLARESLLVFTQKFDKKSVPEIDIDDVVRILKKNHIAIENENGLNIEIDSKSVKFVYRVIDIFLQKGNLRDFFASDGKGRISPFFTDVLNSELSECDQEAVRSLRLGIDSTLINPERESKKLNRNIDSVQNKILEKLKSIKNLSKKLDGYENNEVAWNSDTDKEFSKVKVDFIYDLYSSIEWIIFYKCTQGEIPVQIGLEKLKKLIGNCKSSQLLIQRYFLKTLRKLGYQISEENEKYFLVKIGSINHSVNEEPEMFAICAVAAALADENDDYWFSKMGKSSPDFFTQICKLKNFRDEVRHKNTSSHSSAEILELYEYVNGIFGNQLKPEEDNDDNDLINTIENQNEINKAAAQMEKDLGFALKHSLPENFFTIFEDIERYSETPDINPAIVISFDQILEESFEFLKSNLSKSKGDFREKYKAVWHNDGSQLFNIINEKKIEKEIKGRNTSMQAAFIAWLALEDVSVLKIFANEFPDILEIVCNVAKMRGHGEIPDFDKILKVHNENLEGDFQAKKQKSSEILRSYKNFTIKFVKFLGSNGYFE